MQLCYKQLQIKCVPVPKMTNETDMVTKELKPRDADWYQAG